MERQWKTTNPSEEVTAHSFTLRAVFNGYGLFFLTGLFLSSFLHPLAAMDPMRLQDKFELIIASPATKEFWYFILAIGILYFTLVNLYFVGKGGRVLVALFLIGIALWSICMIFVSYVSPIPH